MSSLLPACVLRGSPFNGCEACVHVSCGCLSAEQFYLFSPAPTLLPAPALRLRWESGTSAASRRTRLCHLGALERRSRAAPDAEKASRIQRAAVVCVAVIRIRNGGDSTHTGINTLQSIDGTAADWKQNRGERGGWGWWGGGVSAPTQARVFMKSRKLHTAAHSASVPLRLFSVKGH